MFSTVVQGTVSFLEPKSISGQSGSAPPVIRRFWVRSPGEPQHHSDSGRYSLCFFSPPIPSGDLQKVLKISDLEVKRANCRLPSLKNLKTTSEAAAMRPLN
ncbi:hypothetical protein BST61_g4646 [Cercospora zeina]